MGTERKTESMLSMVERYFNYKELSERWKRPIGTLRLMVMQKRLIPSLKIGKGKNGRVLFSDSYIRELEAKKQV